MSEILPVATRSDESSTSGEDKPSGVDPSEQTPMIADA